MPACDRLTCCGPHATRIFRAVRYARFRRAARSTRLAAPRSRRPRRRTALCGSVERTICRARSGGVVLDDTASRDGVFNIRSASCELSCRGAISAGSREGADLRPGDSSRPLSGFAAPAVDTALVERAVWLGAVADRPSGAQSGLICMQHRRRMNATSAICRGGHDRVSPRCCAPVRHTRLVGATAMREGAKAAPPVAEVRAQPVISPNGTRIDPYYWLRDDTRLDPKVLGYLNAENTYTDAMLAPLRGLEEKIYQEIVARIPQDDVSVPYRKRGYWYVTRLKAGSEYPIYAGGVTPSMRPRRFCSTSTSWHKVTTTSTWVPRAELRQPAARLCRGQRRAPAVRAAGQGPAVGRPAR